MSRPHRLALLLLPAALALLLAVFPGHAQQTTRSVRFAFADTTMLRDTLGLHFDRLFPLADSLLMTPDSLRAHAIRYRMPLERLVYLSDSLRMPVDSVGVFMERERFNALALSRQKLAKFGYNSGYAVSGNTSTWTNNTDYNFRSGPWFLRNTTNLVLSRTEGDRSRSFSQQRSSTTELSWEFVRNFSMGARVGLQRNANFSDPATIYDFSKRNDLYQFSFRARPRLARNLQTSEVSLYGGPFTEPYSTYDKSGINAVLNGRLRYLAGAWLSEDFSLQATNKYGHARYVVHDALGRLSYQGRDYDTRDFTRDLRSALSLFEAAPASLRLDLSWRKDQAEKPDILIQSVPSATTDTSDILRRDPNSSRRAELTVRLGRQGGDRYVILNQRLADSQRLISDSRNGRFITQSSLGKEQGFSADGRYAVFGWLLESRFTYGRPQTEGPKREVVRTRALGGDTLLAVDYREEQRQRARGVEGTLTRMFFQRLTIKATGRVNLTSYRYAITDSGYRAILTDAYVQGSFNRDEYEQGYRVEGSYTPLQRFSTSLALDVSRRSQLVLPAAGSSRSNELRSYRAEWTWTYRMLPGLTVTQLNQLGADYTNLIFSPDDGLSLSYLTQTNLNAVLSPRLSVQITHRSTTQPSGDYKSLSGGTVEFSPATERSEYTLSGSVSYSPSSFFTLSVQPYYSGTNSETSSGQLAVPSQRQRNLTISGGASLNLPVTKKGRLTGDIRRSFQASRSTRYVSGVPQLEPGSERDYWDGTLQLIWEF